MNSALGPVATAVVVLAGQAIAQDLTLEAWIEDVDRTAISFEGKVFYDRSERQFHFRDADGNFYGMSLDAGRDAREMIENNCSTRSAFVVSDTLCAISGTGTVEIREGRVFLSLDHLIELFPAADKAKFVSRLSGFRHRGLGRLLAGR